MASAGPVTEVAALKATGTGAFGDFNAYTDAGAGYVADFTDVGMVSTYRQPLSRIEAGLGIPSGSMPLLPGLRGCRGRAG